MPLIALTSARGAPGVTTTALALAITTQDGQSLLCEADMAGVSSIAAGYFRGSFTPDRGLISLAIAHTTGALTRQTLLDAGRPIANNVNRLAITGLTDVGQVGSMTPAFWDNLGQRLAEHANTGATVVVDAGRAGMAGWCAPLLRYCSVVLLVSGSSLPDAVSARARAHQLTQLMADTPAGAAAVRLLVIGEGRPHTARQISQAAGVPVMATVPHDPDTAYVLSDGAPQRRRFATSPLIRTIRSLSHQLSSQEAPTA